MTAEQVPILVVLMVFWSRVTTVLGQLVHLGITVGSGDEKLSCVGGIILENYYVW